MANRVVYHSIFSEITPALVHPLVDSLRELTSEDGAEILICSEGGDTDAGFALIDAIRTCPAHVVTIGTGGVGSVATDILVSGDWRIAMPSLMLMTHNAYLPGKPVKGRKHRLLQLEDRRGIHLYMDRTKFKTEEQLRSVLFNGKDVYLDANQALDLTLVDEIRRLK